MSNAMDIFAYFFFGFLAFMFLTIGIGFWIAVIIPAIKELKK